MSQITRYEHQFMDLDMLTVSTQGKTPGDDGWRIVGVFTIFDGTLRVVMEREISA